MSVSSTMIRCWRPITYPRQYSTASQLPLTSPSSENSLESANETVRRKRKKSTSFSPFIRILSKHPKNSRPPIVPVTRRQLLRLTPQQRQHAKNMAIEQRLQNRTILEKARANLRSNLKYIGESAQENLTKNVATLKKLFRGEPIEDIEGNNKAMEQASWEKLPKDLKDNFFANLSTLQNWLHKVTDGVIPSPSHSGEKHQIGSSVFTRLQMFHEAKKNQKLVMDTRWFAWNIAFALLPGVLLHLYCLSKEEEMKEYYRVQEEKQRLKILGITSAEREVREEKCDTPQQIDEGSEAFSTLEQVWQKVKIAMNDLFLDGLEQRKMEQEKEVLLFQSSTVTSEEDRVTPTSSQPIPKYDASIEEEHKTVLKSTAPHINVQDVSMQMLLDRIQKLEKQIELKANEKEDLSIPISHQEEEQIRAQQERQRLKEHNIQYQLERIRQSPIQNRREDHLAAIWLKEQNEKRQETNINGNNISFFQNFLASAQEWIKEDFDLAYNWIHFHLLDISDKFLDYRSKGKNESSSQNEYMSTLNPSDSMENESCEGKISNHYPTFTAKESLNDADNGTKSHKEVSNSKEGNFSDTEKDSIVGGPTNENNKRYWSNIFWRKKDSD